MGYKGKGPRDKKRYKGLVTRWLLGTRAEEPAWRGTSSDIY